MSVTALLGLRPGTLTARVRASVALVFALVVGLVLMHGLGLHGTPGAAGPGHAACSILVTSSDDVGAWTDTSDLAVYEAATPDPGRAPGGALDVAAFVMAACIAVVTGLLFLGALRVRRAPLLWLVPRLAAASSGLRRRLTANLGEPPLLDLLCVSRT